MKQLRNRSISALAKMIRRLHALSCKLGDTCTIPIAVPTVTVIAYRADDPYMVLVIKHHSTKHGGRCTLVGGKVPMWRSTTSSSSRHANRMHTEWLEEAGGKGASLKDLRLWAIKVDAESDVRVVPLSKSTDGCAPRVLGLLPTEAFFGTPDLIYLAEVVGEPAPQPSADAEAVSAEWIDVRNLVITDSAADSQYGAQHDLIMKVYCYWMNRRWQQMVDDFEDFSQLRSYLLAMQIRPDYRKIALRPTGSSQQNT